MLRVCILFHVELGFTEPLLLTYRSAHQHICQVLSSETAKGGDHWRKKGTLGEE